MTFSCYDSDLLDGGSWFGITLCQEEGYTKVYLKGENQSSDLEGEQLRVPVSGVWESRH